MLPLVGSECVSQTSPVGRRAGAFFLGDDMDPTAKLQTILNVAENMDPNANLDELLSLATTLIDIDPDELTASQTTDVVTDATRMSELILALNGWIAKGGFLPRRWAQQ